MSSATLLPIPAEQLVVLGLVFAAVLLSVLGVSWLIRPQSVVERRLAVGTSVSAGPQRPPEVVLRRRSSGGLLNYLYDRLRPRKEGRGRQLSDRLAFAGYRGPGAVRNWVLCRTALSLGLPVIVLAAMQVLIGDVGLGTLLATTVAGGLGFVLPSVWLKKRTRVRTQAIRLAFPDTLDMILVCVEAGLGIDAALHHTTTEIGHAHPVISQEMDQMRAELRAGKPRAEVLKAFADRTGVEEVRSFATVLIHAEQFGTSIADALRVYAAEMRTARLLRAEEEANKLPMKLSLVVAACTFPALFVLLLTPIAIAIMRAFGGMSR